MVINFSISNEIKIFINKIIWNKISKYFLDKNQLVPQIYFKNVDDFKINYQEKYKYTKISDESTLVYNPVKTLNKDLNANFQQKEFIYPEDFILEIHDGKVFGETGLVITPDNCILDNINLIHGHIGGIEKNEIFNKFKMPKIKHLEGNVAVISSLFSNFYYHWMLDILPKFNMLEKECLNIDYYVINSQNLKFQKASLEKLTIPEEKIIILENNSYIQAANLIIPSMPGFTGYDPQWAVEFVRNLFVDETKTENYPKRIYTNRKNAFSRRFVNEKEVKEILNKYDFVEVFLDELSIEEQASLFYNSEILFSPHGGALTNLIFSKAGTKLVEIFSPSMPIPCYWTLANMMKLDYFHIMADCPQKTIKTPTGKYTNQDIIVDLEILENTILLAIQD